MNQYIGLDIGGTKIEGVRVNKDLKLLKKCRIPTQAHKSRTTIVNNIVSVIKTLDNGHVRGIGIGVPGFADKNGLIQLTPNIPAFENFNLKKAIEKKIRRRVRIENDAHCFILAEQFAGCVTNMKNVVGLTFGTGVGGGAIIDGRLLEGKHGGAAHFGHMIIDTCYKGYMDGRGDLEYWCGGKNIERRYHFITKKKKLTSEIFKSKDKVSKEFVDDFHNKLGIAIADLIAAFDPEAVVLGGGISANINIPRLRGIVLRHGRDSLVKETKIVRNKLGGSAGVFGAAAITIR